MLKKLFTRDKLIGYSAEPNAAHRKLAELEGRYRIVRFSKR